MPKNIITIFVIVVFVASFGIGYTFGKKNIQTNTEHKMEMVDTTKTQEVHEISDMSHMMEDMTNGLIGKTDGDFDKAFLDEMIIHHKGAVDMANLALKSTKRKEIIDLSRAIIRAQNEEITDMQNWRKSWFTNK